MGGPVEREHATIMSRPAAAPAATALSADTAARAATAATSRMATTGRWDSSIPPAARVGRKSRLWARTARRARPVSVEPADRPAPEAATRLRSPRSTWQGQNGTGGLVGGPGNGGGGGGAGGGQDDFTVINGTGNGGGGGGGGGAGGSGGGGGFAGGGSFGIYLHDSALVAEGSTITAGNGGAGGRGGSGGSGGGGGGAGVGAVHCSDEIGNGADGGFGGSGGQGGGGGGGAGGPSIGIIKLGAAAVLNLTDTKVTSGNPGPGGLAGAGGTPAPPAQAGITQGIYP